MLKQLLKVKQKEVDSTVQRAVQEHFAKIHFGEVDKLLHECLANDPHNDCYVGHLRVHDQRGEDSLQEHTVPLVIKWKNEGLPQRVREASAQLAHFIAHQKPRVGPSYGIVTAPFISEASAKICEDSGIGYIDLVGNSRISFGPVFIERRVSDRNPAPRQESQSLFSARATRVLRVLLSGPLRSWKVKELAETAQVSLGWVSQVRRQLIAHEWATVSEAGIRITQPSALMDAWAAQDEWKSRTTIQGYSVLSADPNEIATKVRSLVGHSRYAFTQWYAGWLRRPYTTPPIVTVYVEDFPDEKLLEKKLLARPVESGAQLWLVKPRDEGVFFQTQVVNNFILASDVQIYLDLLKAGLRGAEQAKELRNAPDFAGGWS